jgi:hypothetical protein
MSFYTDASLVLIPSGIKDQKVYCAKPVDGSGDLTFTRSNDTATRVGSDGLIEKVRTNLILQSNSFDTTWVNTNSTDTGGQADKDGGTTAWLLESTTAAGEAYLRQTISASGLSTFSIYAKAGTADFLGVYINATTGTDPYVYFNLSTGAVGTTATTATPSIVSVGSGWYRCSVAYNATIANIDVYVTTADGSFLSTTGDNIVIQASQLESGDIATDYIATTSAAVSVGPVANLPRLDYSGGATCPKLLLEPQRTNVLQYSEQLNNVAWSKLNVTVSANQAAAPDGTTSADLVYPTTSGTDRLIEKVVAATSGQIWTSSFFVKASGFDWVLIFSPNLGACWFNASTGVFGTVAGSVTARVLGQVNGFWRVSFTGTLAAANTYFYAGLADANGTTTATVNGTNGLLFFGCQLEEGAYATSYIPTIAATTRGADSCSKTGISSLLGQTEGTIFLEAKITALSQQLAIITSAAGNEVNRLQLYVDATGKIGLYRGDASVSILSASTFAIGSTLKIAAVYKLNDYALYVNGVLVGTDTSATIPPTPSVLYLSQYVDGTASAASIAQSIIFPTRLSNASLAELTA